MLVFRYNLNPHHVAGCSSDHGLSQNEAGQCTTICGFKKDSLHWRPPWSYIVNSAQTFPHTKTPSPKPYSLDKNGVANLSLADMVLLGTVGPWGNLHFPLLGLRGSTPKPPNPQTPKPQTPKPPNPQTPKPPNPQTPNPQPPNPQTPKPPNPQTPKPPNPQTPKPPKPPTPKPQTPNPNP